MSKHHNPREGSVVEQLLNAHPIISDQVDVRELSVLLWELERVLAAGMRGSVVEFGCYTGTTSLFIQRLLDIYEVTVPFHVYDSFEGLPKKRVEDTSPVGVQFQAGALATTKKTFVTNFKKANLKVPVIHKGWFADCMPRDIPNGIMFAFLDGDYYESVRDSLRLVVPKLIPGAIIIIDDYVNEALPGASRAVDEWVGAYSRSVRSRASMAIIQW